MLNFSWLAYNGVTFVALQPVFFINRLDFTRNFLMLTDLQHLLLGNSVTCWCFDIMYVGLPILLTIAVYKNMRYKMLIAICTSVFSLIYGLFFSAVCYMSPELFVGFIFIPLLFSSDSLKGFYYYLHCLRFLFILIFVSAGLWKIRQAGLFNIEEMAGILLFQHNGYITSNDHDWYTKIIYCLVQHPSIAYLFYFIGTCIEFLFVIGLFTRKFDNILIIAFCLFIFFDLFLMRINYFSWMAFMGCFYFSRFYLYDNQSEKSDNVSV
ncbi:MAG TPA: hypothetical protein VK705_02545 [Ferruginibacter sp.]|jgi:hypothetical protein|nr:hypothetical protein [Ferruginibacter sp.]